MPDRCTSIERAPILLETHLHLVHCRTYQGLATREVFHDHSFWTYANSDTAGRIQLPDISRIRYLCGAEPGCISSLHRA